MKFITKVSIIVLSAAFSYACSTPPAPYKSSSPSVATQKIKAEKAQKELADEISKSQ